MIAIMIATSIPAVFAAHQGIDIDTLPYPKAECISGVNNGACYVAEVQLANGTMLVFSIDNSMLHTDDTEQVQEQAQTQTDEIDRDDEGDGNVGDDEGPADLKTGADCWENGDFIGTDECDTGGLPLCSEDDSGRCFDEADAPDV